MSDNLRDRIAAVIRDHPQGQEWGIPDEECTQCPPLRGIDWAQHVADAVIDVLIDMAGKGELLKAIDRMYR